MGWEEEKHYEVNGWEGGGGKMEELEEGGGEEGGGEEGGGEEGGGEEGGGEEGGGEEGGEGQGEEGGEGRGEEGGKGWGEEGGKGWGEEGGEEQEEGEGEGWEEGGDEEGGGEEGGGHCKVEVGEETYRKAMGYGGHEAAGHVVIVLSEVGGSCLRCFFVYKNCSFFQIERHMAFNCKMTSIVTRVHLQEFIRCLRAEGSDKQQ